MNHLDNCRKLARHARESGVDLDAPAVAAAARLLSDRPIGLLVEVHGEDTVQDAINRLASAWLRVADPALLAGEQRVIVGTKQ